MLPITSELDDRIKGENKLASLNPVIDVLKRI